MDDAHRREFTALLAQWRRRVDDAVAALRADLDALAEARADVGADDEHDPEGVTVSAEWSRVQGLLADAQQERDEVDAALGRCDAGTYGVCRSCGRAIPVGRLRVRPTATLCVPCAERAGR